jgi:plastocyanin
VRRVLVLAVALVAVVVPSSASADVSIGFGSFMPAAADALPGETVTWTNTSERRHTVTADDGSFDSGDLFTGDRFEHSYPAVGAYTYHCSVHLGMDGEVDVRRVILDPLPGAAVPVGKPVSLSGRTADPLPLTLERDTGSGFQPVAAVLPGADGTWSASVTPDVSADYRVSSALGSSEARRLLVSDRRMTVSASRGRVSVSVAPADPGARVRLQLRLRERFGWWPAASRRLDYLSRASFRVKRAVAARVVLVDRDGWSPVATSRVVRVRPR